MKEPHKPVPQIGRRDFLKTSAAGLAVAASLAGCSQQKEAPAAAEPQSAGPAKPAPSERVVVGVIGTGDLGTRHHLAGCLLPNPRIEVAAVCDADANRRDIAAKMVFDKTGKRVGIYKDFRKLVEQKGLDAVLIATTDHWHTAAALAAMQAGLDVYCEKPLTLTVSEGQELVRTARRYGTVFQTGSQQRSDPTFRRACELVRNGKIGKVSQIDTTLHPVGAGSWQPVQTPPNHLDWDAWLGQAKWSDYVPGHVHYQFRWNFDYSGGVMTDWGAHHNDIAQWALGMDGSGPVAVDGTNVKFHEEGPYSVAGNFDVEYTYADGTKLICHGEGRNGIKFTGSAGWLFVCRGGVLEASDPEILKVELGAGDTRLYESNDHHNNWIDCIKSRKRCICDVEIGHRSVSVCHIGNISMRLGRALKWDPAKERFIDDEVANRMLSRPHRAPWWM